MSRFCFVIIVSILIVSAERSFSAPPDFSEGMALLESVKDDTFAFDDDAFYWFCRRLRDDPNALGGSICDSESVTPWRFLMERPSDYRGRKVCIEGTLMLEQPAYEVAGRPGVGRLRQLELGTHDSNAVATLILLDPSAVVSKRSLIRATAVFIKVRAFRTASGGVSSGPLLIANTVEVVEPGRNRSGSADGLDARRILPWMAGITLLLFGVMVAIRRNVGAKRPSADFDDGPLPVTGTNEDFDWMSSECGGDPRDQ